MNEWMNDAFICVLLYIVVHPKCFIIMCGVSPHPSPHFVSTAAPVRSPHTGYRWRGERVFKWVSRKILLAHRKTNSSIFSYQTRLELQMGLASVVRLNKQIFFCSKHSRWVWWIQGLKVPHVYNEIYCYILYVVGLYFCWRSWTSCLDTWHHGFYRIPTDTKIKLTVHAGNLIMDRGWVFQQDNDLQNGSLRTKPSFCYGHCSPLTWIQFNSRLFV